MRFKTHAVIQGTPQFTIRAKHGPFAFEAGAEGTLKIATGAIAGRIDEIPITLAIPFLRRRGGVRTVASIGAFGVQIQPLDVEIRAFGVRCSGVLAKDGTSCGVDGQMACKMDVDLTGTVPGRVTKASIEMAGDDDTETVEG